MLRMLVLLGVGITVAQYLGPTELGKPSYALTFAAISSILVNLRMDGFVVRELVNFPEARTTMIIGYMGVGWCISDAHSCFFNTFDDFT